MAELTFYKDYKNNEELRKSFNDLATLVFGLSFEDWYQKGYWLIVISLFLMLRRRR